jgi:hypothetical protein
MANEIPTATTHNGEVVVEVSLQRAEAAFGYRRCGFRRVFMIALVFACHTTLDGVTVMAADIVADVNSRGLTPAQVKHLERQANRVAWWLRKLTGRMHQRHFPRDDPLKRSAEAACEAVANLVVEIEKLAK